MTLWYCDSHCLISNGAGPWEDKSDIFLNIKHAHKNCLGFQIGEPDIEKLTEVEQAFTDYFNQHIHEWFHNLNFYHKGPSKVCLLKDKWKMMNQL